MLSKLGFGLVLVGLLGCGGLQTGKVPVDSPLNEFEAPEEDDLGDDAWEIEEDDEPTADGEPEAESAEEPARAPGDAGAEEPAGGANAGGAKATGGKPAKTGKKKAQGATQAETPAAGGN